MPTETFRISATETETVEWSGVVIHCSYCGEHVELTKDELTPDGKPPKKYLCAECDA